MGRKTLVSMFAALCAVSGLHCAAPAADAQQEAVASDLADKSTGAVSPSTLAPDSHCWAQIERPFPADPVLPLGTALTLRTGGPICQLGVNEKLAYRFYVEKVDKNGKIISPRVSPQGDTGWSFTKSAFDSSTLTAGRYRIYMFSLPRAMVPAWQANDPIARNTSKRSGNAYVDLVTTSWSLPEWGACSTQCGDGTQTRTVACVDQNNVTRPDSMCPEMTKPAAVQACNLGACPSGLTPSSIQFDGFEDFGLTPTSGPHNWTEMMLVPCLTPMPPFGMMMPGTCPTPMPRSNYIASGFWQDAETSARVEVAITFEVQPMAEGDYTPTNNATPMGATAYVNVLRTVDAVTTSYTSTPTSATVKVRFGTDDKLHALVDDPALGSGNNARPIKADVIIDVPPL